MPADLSQLTALVTTCGEPKSLGRLLKSIQRYAPGLKLIVGSADAGPIEGATVVKTCLEAGVNAARNALLARVRTRFFLLLSDQIELSRKSQLETLLAPVAAGTLDLAGGELLQCRKKLLLFTTQQAAPAHATLEIASDSGGDHCIFQAGHRSQGAGYLECDATHSFFVARTDKLRALGGWTNASPFDEPGAFFFRAKRFGLQIGYCPRAIAAQWPAKQEPASDVRQAATCRALGEAGVSRLTDASGQVYESAVNRSALAA